MRPWAHVSEGTISDIAAQMYFTTIGPNDDWDQPVYPYHVIKVFAILLKPWLPTEHQAKTDQTAILSIILCSEMLYIQALNSVFSRIRTHNLMIWRQEHISLGHVDALFIHVYLSKYSE